MSAEMLNREDTFELQLIHEDLLADALFLIGTIIAINQNTADEEKIINPDKNQTPGTSMADTDNAPLGLGTLPLQLFLAATIILAATGSERLNKQKSEAGNSPDQTTANNIKGGEIVIFGQLLRIIGYIISIMGENIKTANPV